MSRLYFHTPKRTAEVLGSELADMRELVFSIALAIVGPAGFRARTEIEPFLVDTPDYLELADGQRWEKQFSMWFRSTCDGGGFAIDGECIGATDFAINTLVAMRSPVLALVAKIHGTYEDWAFIDAEDAKWLAEIIEMGRSERVLRPNAGWESVADLAREVASGLPGPIVLSSSFGEGFPASSIADWTPPTCADCNNEDDVCYACELNEPWDDLDDAERWRLAEAGMRARRHNRQISPATINLYFTSIVSAFDLNEARARAR